MDGNVIHMCVKNHVFFVIAIILIINNLKALLNIE